MQLTLVTLGGLLAAGIVSAAPQYQQSTSNVHRITQRDLTGYDNLGCYTEATSGRALSGKSYSNDSMTLELCQSTCQGFSYFGVEYGRECYCGNNLNTGSVSTASSDCNFACPGNATETCGAGNRLNVYQTTGSGPADFSKYGSHGCYTEPNNAQNGRALMGKTTVSNNMTVENCADICAAGQYSLFGVEYSSECYCGNMLAVGSVAAPASDCKYACSGDKTETCGGDWRFNYYEFGYTPAPSSTTSSATSATSSATSTSSTAASPTAPAGYTDAGCYTEATGQRALTGKSYFDDSMTVEKCAAACTGYEWFGVEYGRECYCGNTINDGSVPTARSECSTPCPGNSAETCGAGNRLNVYHKITGATSSLSSTLSTSASTVDSTSSSSSAVATTSTSATSSSSSTSVASDTSSSAASSAISSSATSSSATSSSAISSSVVSSSDTSTSATSATLTSSSSVTSLSTTSSSATSSAPSTSSSSVPTASTSSASSSVPATSASTSSSSSSSSVSATATSTSSLSASATTSATPTSSVSSSTRTSLSSSSSSASSTASIASSTSSTVSSSSSRVLSSSSTSAPITTSSSSQIPSSSVSSTSITTPSTSSSSRIISSSTTLISITTSSTSSSSLTLSTSTTLRTSTSSASSISSTSSRTTTSTGAGPTQTSKVVAATTPNEYLRVIPGNNNIQGIPVSNIASNFGFFTNGGRPYVAGSPELKWVVTQLQPSSNFGVLIVTTDAIVAANPTTMYPISCKVDSAGSLACSSTSPNGFDTFRSCADSYYFGTSSANQIGCQTAPFKLLQ